MMINNELQILREENTRNKLVKNLCVNRGPNLSSRYSLYQMTCFYENCTRMKFDRDWIESKLNRQISSHHPNTRYLNRPSQSF